MWEEAVFHNWNAKDESRGESCFMQLLLCQLWSVPALSKGWFEGGTEDWWEMIVTGTVTDETGCENYMCIIKLLILFAEECKGYYAGVISAHVVVECGLKTRLHLYLYSMCYYIPEHLRRWFSRLDGNSSSMHLGCSYTCTFMQSSTIRLQSNHPKRILVQGVKRVHRHGQDCVQ